MPPKPRYPRNPDAPPVRTRSRVKQMTSAVKIQRAVRSYLNKKIETKKSNFTSTDGTQISHNSFVNVDTKVLATTQGVADPVKQTKYYIYILC